MKWLLYSLLTALTLWIASELLEIINGGYTPAVFILTAAFHLLAGIGIWGLYRAKDAKRNSLSLVAILFISLGYLSLVWFPIQLMQSGLSPASFMEGHPIYRISGLFYLSGFVIFGISIIRYQTFPIWSGVLIIACNLIFAFGMVKELSLLVNINNILLALVILYLGGMALRERTT